MYKSFGTTSTVVQVFIVTLTLVLLGADEDHKPSFASSPPQPPPPPSSSPPSPPTSLVSSQWLPAIYQNWLALPLPRLHLAHRRLPTIVSAAHIEELQQKQQNLLLIANHPREPLDLRSNLSASHDGQNNGANDIYSQGNSASGNRRAPLRAGRVQSSANASAQATQATAAPVAELAFATTGDKPPFSEQRTKPTETSTHTHHLNPLSTTTTTTTTTLSTNSTKHRQHSSSSGGEAENGASGRHRRLAMDDPLNPDCELQVGGRRPAIFGLRCDDSEVTEDGTIIIEAFTAKRIYVIGRNLYSNLTVALTEQEASVQDDCTHFDRIKSLRLYNISLNVGEIIVDLPPPEKSVPYYLCIREHSTDAHWYHQGSAAWLRIAVQQDFLPLWAKIITIAVLLSMSGLFSGLNLGLMALDKNELQVIMKCGTDDEKRYATAIEPVRRRGNYLLCSILFSNTLVNSTISVFLEDLSSGMAAIVMSTVLIVLFGEILPQAFCSRHGLAVGAKTIWLTHFCMFITFPLSYPVSYCLDWALGEEIGHAYDRERLMEFIQVTRDVNNLGADEVNIIAGALKIKRVKVCEVMTKIEDVYMLDENAVLDFETIQAIVAKGYSRIPVHEVGNKRNIKAVLFAKDLALVDPDDRTPVQTMINFYSHPVLWYFEDEKLDKVLNDFKDGRSHMAFVRRVVNDGEHDPDWEVTGIVTLEDVIEEIMQMEINDETDTLTDNRRKRRRDEAQIRKDFSQFTNLGTGDSSFNVVTPQLCLAAYQYLATTVEPFTQRFLSDSILRRLMSQKIFYKARLEDDLAVRRLYTAGEPADYFIMILEGRVHVICGKENLVFDGGPFSFFGKAALSQIEAGDLRDPLSLVAGATATVPTLPVVAPAAPVATVRKDSARPTLSRRESLAKIVTGQLGGSSKKQPLLPPEQPAEAAPLVGDPASALLAGDLSPTSMAKREAFELLERGVYCFKPDYTVDIIANTSYLKVTRNDYITALRATQVERESTDTTTGLMALGAHTDGNVETTFIFDNLDPATLTPHFSNDHDQAPLDSNNHTT